MSGWEIVVFVLSVLTGVVGVVFWYVGQENMRAADALVQKMGYSSHAPEVYELLEFLRDDRDIGEALSLSLNALNREAHDARDWKDAATQMRKYADRVENLLRLLGPIRWDLWDSR